MRSRTELKDTDLAALFRMLLSTAVDGILVIDAHGLVLVYNQACEELFGYTPDEVLGRNIKMLMPSPYHDEHDGYLEAYRKTGHRKIIGIGREVMAACKDGSTFPIYLSVGEGSMDDKPVFVGIVHDITERKQALGRLQEVQADLVHVSRLNEMGQMISLLAHELNQPLTAIMNYMNAAGRMVGALGVPQAERARELMSKASDQAARAGQIIRRLRDFVEKRETSHMREDLNELIEEAIELALLGSADMNVKVTIDLAPHLPPVFVDKIQIQQVVLNLARNAIEAMQSVSVRRLAITTQADDDCFVRISVEDTGPGLLPEVAERLFQPFVTTKSKGMGIGLSICRTIVGAHGGELWMSPNGGEGTAFHFTLPTKKV